MSFQRRVADRLVAKIVACPNGRLGRKVVLPGLDRETPKQALAGLARSVRRREKDVEDPRVSYPAGGELDEILALVRRDREKEG